MASLKDANLKIKAKKDKKTKVFANSNTVALKCKKGFKPDGDNEDNMDATCTDGTWSTPPSCVPDPGGTYHNYCLFQYHSHYSTSPHSVCLCSFSNFIL